MAQSNKNFTDSPCKRNCTRGRKLSSMSESRPLPAYFQKENEDDVLNALEAIETDVTLGKPIRWKKLLPAIRGMKLNTETAQDCLNFAKALLCLFERYHCKDIRVIMDIFAVLLFITDPYFISMEDFEIDFERKFFFYPYGKVNTNIDIVWEAVSSANLGLLKLQLKFGMEMMLPYDSDFGFYIYTLLHDWRINPDDDIRQDESTYDYEILLENGIITGFGMDEEEIEENIFRNFNTESKKRLRLVLRMLELVHLTKAFRTGTENYFECYRLLFDSIPAAFVTSVEVKASLRKCLPVSCSRLISRIAQDFKNILPELAEVPQPRSLKHLCRIEVRRNLRQNLNLPSGVSLLPLPKILKEYITLNDDGHYSGVIENSRVFGPRRDTHSKQELHITIPERDDCVTSFLKNL